MYSFILYGDACCIESLSGEQEASADLSTFLLFIGEEVKVNQSDVLLNLHTSEASACDGGKYFSPSCTEAEFLDRIQTKVFLLTIHSHLYRFALRNLFLQTYATSYSFHSSVTVHTL
jgi:hypothetical protein